MMMLNENLREKITVYLNGRILRSMKFFEVGFEIDFLSELTFYFQMKSYSNEDFLFQEGSEPLYIYYIVSGKIAMVHK
jgi:CRP-like cAMP-binding protein